MKRATFVFIFLGLLSTFCRADEKFVIKVSSQSDFDNIGSLLNNVVNDHRDIQVQFAPGVFQYNESNIISLSNTSSSISFIGAEGTILRSDGEVYHLTKSNTEKYGKWRKVRLLSAIDKYCTFLNQDGKRVFVSDTGYLNGKYHTNIATEQIDVVDETSGVAQIRIPDELNFLRSKPQTYFYGSLLVYKSQWSDAACEILWSDDRSIYFKLDTFLINHIKDFVSNMFTFSSRYYEKVSIQPFYITNVLDRMEPGTIGFDENYLYVPEDVTELYVLRYGKFASFTNCTGGLSFKGLTWSGSNLGQYIQSRDFNIRSGNGLISMIGCKNIRFEDCCISAQGHGLIGPLKNSSDITISRCEFTDNYDDNIIESLGGINNMVFSRNHIHNSHQFITCRMALYLKEDAKNILVSDNDAQDLTRSLLFYLKGENVVVERNVLHNSEQFNKYPRRNMSSDTGVLTYSTGGHPIAIRDNVVFNLAANYNYSGIMIDNGTGRAEITGNLMFNIGDHTVNCWKNGGEKPICIGNKLIGNVLIGNVNFGGYDVSREDNASYSDNVFVPSKGYSILSKSKATDGGGNIILSPADIVVSDDAVVLPQNVFNKLNNVPVLRNYVKHP